MLRPICLVTALFLICAAIGPEGDNRRPKPIKIGAPDSASAGLYLFGGRDEKPKERYEGRFSDSKLNKSFPKRRSIGGRTPLELSGLDPKALKELHEIQSRDDLTKKQYYGKIDAWAKKQGPVFYKKFSRILERYGERRKFLNRQAQVIFDSLTRLYSRCKEIMSNDALTKKEMLHAFNEAFEKANRWSVTALRLIEFGAKRDYYAFLRRQRLFGSYLRTPNEADRRPPIETSHGRKFLDKRPYKTEKSHV